MQVCFQAQNKPFASVDNIFFISIFLNRPCEKVFFIAHLHHSTSAEIILAKKEEVNFIVKLPIYFSSPQFHCSISAAQLDRQHHNEIIEKGNNQHLFLLESEDKFISVLLREW